MIVEPAIEDTQTKLVNNVIKFIWHDKVWQCRMYCRHCGKGKTSPLTRAPYKDSCVCLANKTRAATVMERYGVSNVTQLSETREKQKATSLEKYGVDNPGKCPAVREKAKATNLERLGVEYPTQSQEVMAKVQKTNMDNLGVPWPMQSEETRKKSRASNTAALGVPYPTQAESVNDKRSATCLERFGYTCSLMAPEVKAKADATNIEKYGVSNPIMNRGILGRALATASETRYKSGFRSNKEKELEAFVKSLGLSTTHHASGEKEIDIFIPSIMFGIEFNGVYWHTEARGRDQNYHKNKTKLAAEEGITLIHIWEHLWDKRKTQVKDFIKAKLGMCPNRVGMRKCEFKAIPQPEAAAFMENFHIQGKPASILTAYGAYYAGELLAVACFGKHHRGGEAIVLNRLCSAPDWVVSGFLGKVIRRASLEFKQDIISWVDLCLSTGKSYTNSGFSVDAVLKPDYFYVNNHGKVVPKQSFRKIDDRTESERAKDEKMSRVWDCGKIRFRFKYNG